MGIAADFVLIVVAGLIGAVAARFLNLPLLVGYVAAGIAVGPHTSGPTVVEIHDIELLAELGVALLLFSLGLEISLRDLMAVRRVALGGGVLEILAVAALASWAGVQWLGVGAVEAVWFGTMVSLSSTMVVLKTLAARGVTSTLASRVMIGLLVLQDLAVIPMLVILPRLGAGGTGVMGEIAKSVAVAAAILGGTILAGTRVLPPVLRALLTWGSRELFLVAVVATGVGIGYGMHAAGLSFALGAFVAGIILSESEFSHQALSDVVPLRDIFGLLFFVSVGMLFEPAAAAAQWQRIAVVVIAILAGKALVFGLITRGFGYVNLAPWIVGFGLAQIGEFSFVLARAGLSSGAISKSLYELVLSCTIITMAVSPLVSNAGLALGRRWRARSKSGVASDLSVAETTLSGHVVLGGYGRTGRGAAGVLRKAGIPVMVVESNYSLWSDARAAGIPAVLGDMTSPEILSATSLGRARLLIIATPDRDTVRLTIDRAKAIQPDLAIIARASAEGDLPVLAVAGVSVVQPEFEGGVEMVRLALRMVDVPPGEAETYARTVRENLYQRDAG